MPHLQIDRLRSFPTLGSFSCNRKEYPTGAFLLEVLDIIAGIVFVIGSFCFMPPYSDDVDVFLAGCILFVVGGAIYMVNCGLSFWEAVNKHGLWTLEGAENTNYLLGSWLFLVGTFLYWPEEAHYKHIENIKDMSLGQLLNLMSPEFEGTLLFMAGSCMFAFGAFFNALNQREFDEWTSKLLSAITSLYLGGSLLFCMGSVAFLPGLGCGRRMEKIGAWNFVVGSFLFLMGGCLSLWRTTWISRNAADEDVALKP